MNKRVAEVILILYIIMAGVYSVYAAFSDSGLAAYIIMLQFKLIGSAYAKLTAAFCLMLFILPIMPLLKHFPNVKRWFYGGGLNAKSDSLSTVEQESSGVKTYRRPFSTKLLIFLLLVPSLVGLGAHLYMSDKNKSESSAIIGELSLNESAKIVPPAATIVRTSGVLQNQWAYILKRTENGQQSGKTSYVPLTGPGWVSNQAVNAVATIELQGNADSIWLEKGVFVGKVLHKALPPYVQKSWEENGLRLAPDLIVLEHRWMQNGKVVPKYGSIDFGLITPLLAGLFFGGLMFVAGLLSNFFAYLRSQRS